MLRIGGHVYQSATAGHRNFTDFLRRLRFLELRLDELGVNYEKADASKGAGVAPGIG